MRSKYVNLTAQGENDSFVADNMIEIEIETDDPAIEEILKKILRTEICHIRDGAWL